MKVVGNDDNTGAKVKLGTPAGREMLSELARKSGAGRYQTPGVMCQQGQDWSRPTVSFPQKLVQLVGYRDPDARPSSPLPRRPMAVPKKQMPSDTPIG